MKIRVDFFKSINNIDKPLVRLTEKKERGLKHIKTDMKEKILQLILLWHKKIITDYYEQLYAKKFKKLEETEMFLETNSPPKVDQEETDNLNRQVH